VAYVDISYAMRILHDSVGLSVEDLIEAFKSVALRNHAGFALVINPIDSPGLMVTGVGDKAMAIGYELAELVKDFINRRERGELPDLEKELTAFALNHGVTLINVSGKQEAYLVITKGAMKEEMFSE